MKPTPSANLCSTPRRLMVLLIAALCMLAWSGILLSPAAANNWQQPRMIDYIKEPPFMSYSVKPNIMIILDNSGSMNESAYGTNYLGEPYDGTPKSSRSISISSEADNLQEDGDGFLQLEDGDIITPVGDGEHLELGTNLVGLRFVHVEIPQGAEIDKAFIRFKALSGASIPSLTIWGEASDNAEFINSEDPNNLSGRDKTNATATWTPAAWSEGESYDTVDISPIIQEIVSRTEWRPSNSLLLGIDIATEESDLLSQAFHTTDVDGELVTVPGPELHIEFFSSNPGTRYYGYYNPGYFYRYDGNPGNTNAGTFRPKYKKINYNYSEKSWNVKQLDGTADALNDDRIVAEGLWDGNWLNWVGMRRIDVMRKVLVGGLANPQIGDGQGSQVNIGAVVVDVSDRYFSKTFLSATGAAVSPYTGETTYLIQDAGRIRIRLGYNNYRWYTNQVEKSIEIEPEDFFEGNLAGLLQRVGDRARWGNMWFNFGTGSGRSGGFVQNPISNGFTEEMVTDIQTRQCTTWTPLAETFYVAMQYFAQESVATGLDYPSQSSMFEISKGQDGDPFYDSETDQDIPCTQSFILLLTDGASTMDVKVPSNFTGYASEDEENVPERWRPENYDHFNTYTSGTTCSSEGTGTCVYSRSGTDYLADLALYARTNDLRSGGDFDNFTNNLTLYTVFAFGEEGTQEYNDATELLKRASLLGGYGDEDNSGTPDTYYEANNGYLLEEQLQRAIRDILARTSSGTATSVVSSSRSGEGAVYQSIFFSEKNEDDKTVTWAGQINALLVDAYGNLREDTTGDKRLDVDEDYFLVFCEYLDEGDTHPACAGRPEGDTSTFVRKFEDIDGNGRFTQVDLDEGPISVNGRDRFTMDEIQYLWTSIDWLHSNSLNPLLQRNYGANLHRRHIFTFVDAEGTMVPGDGDIKPFLASSDPTWETMIDPSNFFAYLHTYNPFEPPDTVQPNHSDFKGMVTRQARRIVNFIRGQDQNEDTVGTTVLEPFRNRRIAHGSDGLEKTWRLADIVHSSPTVVGRPAENFDLIYRDTTYSAFRQRYRYRRNVLYTGSNGGMLHAFNAGFYDTNNKKFTTRPVDGLNNEVKMPDGTSQYNNIDLGAELWAYVPFNLLPHLYWLTRPDYQHIYYVDLEPRVFDARIFTPDADHPNGWGTVLVAGMRFGGGKIATNMDKTETAFNPDKDRAMSSAYAVFDITNPEAPPRLLAELSFPELGFTTCHPGVAPMREVRVKDNGDIEEVANKWYLLFGSGPISEDAFGDPGANNTALIDGTSDQQAVMYAVDLAKLAQDGQLVMVTPDGTEKAYSPGDAAIQDYFMVRFDEQNSSVSKPIVVDWDLDYKSDAVYFGTSSGNLADGWHGKMRRIVLDTGDNTPTDPSEWVTDSTLLDLTAVVPTDEDDDTAPKTGQPIMAPATAAVDRMGNRWLYFGTGRFYSLADKLNLDQQAYYGVKEPLGDDFLPTYAEVPYTNLKDVSDIKVYENGYYLANYEENKTWFDLRDDIADNYQGWRMDFEDPGERNIGQAVLAGEILTFTTFIPSDDLCNMDGESILYALYYLTGTAYRQSVIGLNYWDLAPQDSETPLVLKRQRLTSGMTTTPNIHGGRQEGTTAFIQTPSGGIQEIEQRNPGAVKSGKVMWRPDEECAPED